MIEAAAATIIEANSGPRWQLIEAFVAVNGGAPYLFGGQSPTGQRALLDVSVSEGGANGKNHRP
jgi:hypothetical protein